MRFKLRYTNFIGLASLLGTVAGLVAAGIVYPINPYAAIPFALLAIVSLVVFVLFVYNFIRYSPAGDVPDDEAKSLYADDDE
jgi:hypothetical protein